MTLTRSPFRIIIASVTRGWSYTATAGADDADQDVIPIEVAHTWGFADDKMPAALEPAELTATIAARSVALLPKVMAGDIIRVTAIRQLPPGVGGSVPYFEFLGRLGEPALTVDPHATLAARLTLTAADHLADLNQRYPAYNINDPLAYAGPGRIRINVAPKAQVNVVVPTAASASGSAIYGIAESMLNQSAGDVFTTTGLGEPLAGDYTGTDPNADWVTYVPRPIELDAAGHAAVAYEWASERGDPTTDLTYVGQPIVRRLPAQSAALVLVWPAGAPRATAGPASAPPAGVTAVAGDWVATPVSARQQREAAVDTLVVEGFTSVIKSVGTATPPAPQPTTVDYESTTRSVRRAGASSEFGAVSRTVQSYVTFADVTDDYQPVENSALYLARMAAAFLPDGSADAQPWGADELELRTWLMSDADLDRLAPQFFPPVPDTSSSDWLDVTPLRQLVLTNTAGRVELDHVATMAIIVGATHRFAGGRVTITPRLAGGVLALHPDSVDAVTAADLTAAGAPWSTMTAQQIDPTLTAVHARLIGAPA